jgi:hypothetical protein
MSALKSRHYFAEDTKFSIGDNDALIKKLLDAYDKTAKKAERSAHWAIRTQDKNHHLEALFYDAVCMTIESVLGAMDRTNSEEGGIASDDQIELPQYPGFCGF